MFLNKLNSYKFTCFGPLLSFFVKMYKVILNQTLNNGKIEKSPRKNGKDELKTQETRGKRMKNVPKTPRSGRHLCFSHYSNYQYFPPFFQYQYQYQFQNSKKNQYQYQNQYFGDANFNINIKINILKL